MLFITLLELYAYIGTSYKFDEKEHYYLQDAGHYLSSSVSSPVSFQLELGAEWQNGIKIGYRHDSVLTEGCPFDCSVDEYTREEVFIGYKIGGQ